MDARPDSARPDSARPDSDRPDSARPDSARADSARADSARADSARPAPLAMRAPARRSIDCDECVMADTHACDDCVVTFIVRREPGDALVIDAAEERALRALGDGGLVPRLRHRSRTG